MVLTSLQLNLTPLSRVANKPFQVSGSGTRPQFGSASSNAGDHGDRVDFNAPGNTGSLGSISLVLKNGLLDLSDLPGIRELNLAGPLAPMPGPKPWPRTLRLLQSVGHLLHYCLVRPFVGNNDIELDHPLVNKAALNQSKAHWDTKVRPAIDALNKIPMGQFFPFALDRYQFFKIPVDYVGIPPAVEIPRYEDAPPSKNTHGVLSALALSLIDAMPAGKTLEDTLGQLYSTFLQITRQAGANTPPFTHAPGLDASGGMRAGGPEILPLKTMYSSLQTSHMVFIAPNGALQIVARPNAQVMAEILANDPTALRALDEQHPLNQTVPQGLAALTDKPYDAANTLAYLKTLTDGRARQSNNGWTDVHTVLRHIPIDFAKHIADKRLRILLEKPGANGETVWQTAQSSSAPAP